MNIKMLILVLLMSVINMGLQAYTPAQEVRNYKAVDTNVQPSNTAQPSTSAVQPAVTQASPSSVSGAESAASQVPTSTAAAQQEAVGAAEQKIASSQKGSFGFFF